MFFLLHKKQSDNVYQSSGSYYVMLQNAFPSLSSLLISRVRKLKKKINERSTEKEICFARYFRFSRQDGSSLSVNVDFTDTFRHPLQSVSNHASHYAVLLTGEWSNSNLL